MEAKVTHFNAAVAVQITLPASASSGVRLSVLIAQSTVVTPIADLPSDWQSLSTAADGKLPTGSNPLSRAIARRCGQVVIENHAANFNSDYAPAMPAPVIRIAGTPFTTIRGLDAVRRTYVRNAANATALVTALCLLMPSAVIDET